MKNELRKAVNAAGVKAQYDACVKRLLGQKEILAHILVRCVDEFKGMSPKEAVAYIEGEPYIGNVPSEPGLTNAVVCMEEAALSVSIPRARRLMKGWRDSI